jgi:hypothetical protein
MLSQCYLENKCEKIKQNLFQRTHPSASKKNWIANAYRKKKVYGITNKKNVLLKFLAFRKDV